MCGLQFCFYDAVHNEGVGPEKMAQKPHWKWRVLSLISSRVSTYAW